MTDRQFKGVWIPAEVWLDKTLTLQEKVMLIEIDSLQSEDRGCFKSNASFSEFFGLSPSRVSRVISSLESKGWIRVEMIREGKMVVERRIHTEDKMRLMGYCGNARGVLRKRHEGYCGNDMGRGNSKSNTDRDKRSATSREPSPTDVSLAELMAERVGERTGRDKSGSIMSWANTIRLMRERDGSSEEQIRYLIEWTHSHSFWRSNILSPDKMRKQWDRLALQARDQKTKLDNRHSNLAPATSDGLKETEGGGFRL